VASEAAYRTRRSPNAEDEAMKATEQKDETIIHLVTEQSGVGQLIEPVAAYADEAKARRHVEIAKALMPNAANKLVVRSFTLNDEKLP
jgi:hypothetical protein